MSPLPFSFGRDRDLGTLEPPRSRDCDCPPDPRGAIMTKHDPQCPRGPLSPAKLEPLFERDRCSGCGAYPATEHADDCPVYLASLRESVRRERGDPLPRPADMPDSLTLIPENAQLLGGTPATPQTLRRQLDRWGTGYRLEPNPDDPHDWIAVWPVEGWQLPVQIP